MNDTENTKVGPFIFAFWNRLFKFVDSWSPYKLYMWAWRKKYADRQEVLYRATDGWVLLYIVLSIFALFILSSLEKWCLLVAYAIIALRLIGIVAHHYNTVFSDVAPTRNTGDFVIYSYRRSVVMALHNYVEVCIWFAAIYQTIRPSFEDKSKILAEPVGSLYFSVVTMTTVGYGDITPIKSNSQIIVLLQTGIGLFIVLIIIGSLVGFILRRGELYGRVGPSTPRQQESKGEVPESP